MTNVCTRNLGLIILPRVSCYMSDDKLSFPKHFLFDFKVKNAIKYDSQGVILFKLLWCWGGGAVMHSRKNWNRGGKLVLGMLFLNAKPFDMASPHE